MQTVRASVELSSTEIREVNVPREVIEADDYLGNLSEYLGEEVVNAYWSPFIEE